MWAHSDGTCVAAEQHFMGRGSLPYPGPYRHKIWVFGMGSSDMKHELLLLSDS